MKKVICAKDIEALEKKGEKTLYVDAGTILTPSAKDAVKAGGIEIIEGCAPCAPTADIEGCISSETIYQALKAMLSKGMLDNVVEAAVENSAAPYLSESHASGLKLVRGNTVKMENLDVGVADARVCYQEMVGKGEATTSAGFLEIENSRFDWELEYEETDYVVEGTMTVSVDNKTFTAHAGDMFFLPKGSKVVMGSPDRCKVFYTTYPAL